MPVSRYSRILLGANVALAISLLAAVGVTPSRPGQSGGAEGAVFDFVAQQAQTAASLLVSELETVWQQTRAAADLATHIFSNPDSYRLSAQPGEYDYDQDTELYASARNDATAVVFLSAASTLNPEILREIRLSEYLNPVFKSAVALNPLSRSVALYTSDGLVRSHPWFDLKSRIASGTIQTRFSAAEIPFFSKAMPAQNPSKEAVWEVVVNGSATGNTQLVCAVPFLASDIVRGIVATEVDSERLAERLASNLKALRAAGFLLAGGERVLATIRTPDGSAGLSGPLAVVLKDQKLAGLEFLFKRESNSERFVGRQSGFYVAIRQAALLPLKAVLVVPEAFVPKAIRSSQEPGGRPFWWLIGAGLAGALLLVDVWWLSRMRQQVAESDKKLSDSLTALSDLNLQSALVAGREGMAREQPQRLQEGLASTRKALEAGRGMTAPEELAAVTAESVDNLKRLEQLASVVAVFSANDSAEGNLGRLAEALRRAFGARRVSILSYSEPASKFVPREAEGLDAGAAIDSASRALFGALKQGEGVISSNLLTVPSDEERSLSPLVQGGYLAVPLLDGQRVLGAVVVSDIPAGVSNTDEAALEALQRALSNTVQNIDRCDRLARLNQLRREYSVELAKAVEAPLDRIRTEVQSIYARLGRLTPYYKHHCETILFEAGKLYEMLREVREAETAIDRDAAQPAAASKALPFGSDPASGD